MVSVYTQTIAALERSLSCSMIATAINFTDGVRPLDVDDADLGKYAEDYQFSQVPLSPQAGSPDARVTHVALIDFIEWRVLERRPVAPEDLLAGSTPIDRTIHLLTTRPFYFVLENDRISKILTRSDLNRLPVRTYLHTLLDHLESLLSAEIVATYGTIEWLTLLTPQRREQVRALHELKKRDDFDSSLIDCTTFSDKARILSADPEKLPAAISSGSRKGLRRNLGRIRALRDKLAHDGRVIPPDIDRLRNHLRHGDQLTKRSDVSWLSDKVALLTAWIDVLEGRSVER